MSYTNRNEALPSSPSGTKINTRSESSSNRGTTGARSSNINIAIGLNRRSSDSDLSITPKGKITTHVFIYLLYLFFSENICVFCTL